MAIDTQTKVIIGAVGVVTIVALIMARKVSQGLNAVNPLNRDNVIAGTVNDIGAYLFDEPKGTWTLGGAIYDWTHPEPDKPAPPAYTPAPDVVSENESGVNWNLF